MERDPQDCYGIRDVVRRTGLSAPAVRMWEKRYGAVTPQRTASNRRLYTLEDVERLGLLQGLTERGHAISTIANLSLAQLRERLAAEESSARKRHEAERKASPCRVITVGSGVPDLLSTPGTFEINHVAAFETLSAAAESGQLPEADLLVIVTDSLFPEMVSTILSLVDRARASRTVLSYRFTASRTVAALGHAIPGLSLLAAPVSDDQLRRECLVQLNALTATEPQSMPIDAGPIPDRLYTEEELVQLSRISTTVECECPQHLAGLLQSLAAFETYSRDCEDRNPQDAMLHAFLHRTTAKVRRLMEEALQHVVRIEGITLR